ncbi:unnamed protein product [Allacma fusca]|uniref:Uncharacterized protein n=1 Tax=Allacma fusca TaxID=39272 RepID=A0A8J2NGF7_9HEXA|nr:unnamed protein product [Allacma fusca]
MEFEVSGNPDELFHKVFEPEVPLVPISVGIGQVLLKTVQRASRVNTIPLELDSSLKRVHVCKSRSKWFKFWLNCIWIITESIFVDVRFVQMNYYKMDVSTFQYLYTTGLAAVYSSGAIVMLLTYYRRYEFQDLINAVNHFNRNAGSRSRVRKKLTWIYLILSYLPIGVYLLSGSVGFLFLASKDVPGCLYSIMDLSYRDSWFILIPHALHEMIVPANVCTSLIFPVLWFVGFMELVKLKFMDFLCVKYF